MPQPRRRRPKGIGPKLKAVHVRLDPVLYKKIESSARRRGLTIVARMEEMLRLAVEVEAESEPRS